MPIAHVASTEHAKTEVTTTSLPLVVPTGVTTGHLLIAEWSQNGGSSPTMPAGWTLLYSSNAQTTVTNPKVFVYWKFATATESAGSTVNITLSAAIAAGGGIHAYSGVDSTTPFDTSVVFYEAATGANSAIHPGLTTTTADTRLIGAMGANSSNVGNTFTTPTGWTKRRDTGGKRSTFADVARAATGATGSHTWAWSSNSTPHIVWEAALRPAAGGSTVSGAAELVSASAVTAGADRTQPAAAALTSSSTLTAAAAVTTPAAAALTSPSSLAAGAVRTQPAAAALTSTSSVGATSGSLPGAPGLTVTDFTVSGTMTAPWYGVFNADSLADKQGWKAAGGTHVVIAARWSDLEPGATPPGALDATALTALKQQFADAATAGLGVIFSFSTHYTPAWIKTGAAAAPRFKAQDSSEWTSSNSLGDDVVDVVWSQVARDAIAAFLWRVWEALTTAEKAQVVDVRLGGGPYGELHYPTPGASQKWWGYSTPAQTGTGLAAGMAVCPVPGHTPFAAYSTGGQLTANAYGIETSAAAWEAANAGTGTPTRVTTAASEGTASLRWARSDASSLARVRLVAAERVAVSPGQSVTVRADLRNETTGRFGLAAIEWYDAGGSLLSTTMGAADVATSSTAWTAVTVTGTAPASAAKYGVMLQVHGNGAAQDSSSAAMLADRINAYTGANPDVAFTEWYLDALNRYMLWQVDRLRTLGYGGTVHVLHPSFGLRSNMSYGSASYITQAAEGVDWARQVAAYPDVEVWPQSTWANDEDRATPVTVDSDKAAWRKLLDVATTYGRTALLGGENTGGSDPTWDDNADIDRMFGADGAYTAGRYQGLTWLNWPRLTGTGPGEPTATHADLARLSQEMLATTPAAASLVSTSAIGAGAVRTVPAAAALVSPSAVGSASARTVPATATMVSASAVGTDPTRIVSATLSLLSSSSVGATGTRTVPTAAALVSPSGVNAASTPITPVSVALISSSAISVTGVRAVTVNVALISGSIVGSVPIRTTSAAVTLTSSSSVGSTAVTLTPPADVTVTPVTGGLDVTWTAVPGAISYTVEWVEVPAGLSGSAALVSPSAVGAIAAATRAAGTSLTSSSAVGASPTRMQPAAASVVSPSAIAAAATVGRPAAAPLVSPSTLTVAGAARLQVTAQLQSLSVLTALGVVVSPITPWDRVSRTSTPISVPVGTSTAITASVGTSMPVPVAVGASTAVAQAAGGSTPVTQPDGVSIPIPAAVGTSTATLVPAGTSTPNTTTPEA